MSLPQELRARFSSTTMSEPKNAVGSVTYDDSVDNIKKESDEIEWQIKSDNRIFWAFLFVAFSLLTAIGVFYALRTGSSMFNLPSILHSQQLPIS